MPESLLVVVEPGGTLRFVWDDHLAGLARQGTTTIRRASHVEWDDAQGGWTVDLSPVDGPVLGPFPLRGDALDEERRWIEAHL